MTRGYTLAEVLVVTLIICIMAGSFAFIYNGVSKAGAPVKEAQALSRWLTNLITISNRTGRTFLLRCPNNVRQDFVEATWLSSMEKNTYTSVYGCVFRGNSGGAESRYSPQWSSMTPTVTIRVSNDKETHYVIVSRHGRVRISKSTSS